MILTYSGTGNSFYVAELLQTFIGVDIPVLKLEGEILISSRPKIRTKVEDKGTVVWIMPVYSWGVPPIMVNFIKNVELNAPNARHHLIMTCGDDIGKADYQWKKLISERGWITGNVWTIQMPNTYTLMKGFDVDNESLEIEKLSKAYSMVESIAKQINGNLYFGEILRGSFPTVKSKIIYPWFVRFEMSPKPFYATDKCISCGLCEEKCPTLNIKMIPENDLSARPKWGDRCALCLRCFHHCPANAIQYGKATKNKGQYKIKKLLGTIENSAKR